MLRPSCGRDLLSYRDLCARLFSAVPEHLGKSSVGREMGIRLCLALVAGLTVTALLVPATQGATAPQRYAAGFVPSRLGSPDPRDTAALDAIPAALTVVQNPAGLVPSHTRMSRSAANGMSMVVLHVSHARVAGAREGRNGF
jgi:hypothetical protein